MEKLLEIILDYLTSLNLDKTSIFVYSIFFTLTLYLFNMVFKALRERKAKILEYEIDYVKEMEEIKKKIFLYLSHKENIMQIKATLYKLQLLLEGEPKESLEIINPENSKTYEEINLKNIIITINILAKPRIRYVKLNLESNSNSFIDSFIVRPFIQGNIDILVNSIIITCMILLISLSTIIIIFNIPKYSILTSLKTLGLLSLLMAIIIAAEKIVIQSSKSTFKKQYEKLKIK